jgi:hypothetical protein
LPAHLTAGAIGQTATSRYFPKPLTKAAQSKYSLAV